MLKAQYTGLWSLKSLGIPPLLDEFPKWKKIQVTEAAGFIKSTA